ncbi:MAG: hypothetical protein M1542_08295 [Thermotogae bacterium]|jgi:hypothetical protein|nr:hypothetical protein [Thermotogota bacterium]MCL5033227.1 hypothetical protein [Thermotogota bacterium]
MRRFKKLSIVFLLIGIIGMALVLSSCNSYVFPTSNSSIQVYYPYFHVTTGNLNCAGWTVTGKFNAYSFNMDGYGNFSLTTWSNQLPPSNFDVVIMTSSQFNDFVKAISDRAGSIGFSYIYKWDLTSYPSLNGYNFYLNTTGNLSAGTYFLVFFNNYLKFGTGDYGQATFNLNLSY